MNREFNYPVRVFIEDTDAAGIVFYVNYLRYMERSRTEHLRSMDYSMGELLATGLALVVHSTQVEYIKPARLDDLLTVTSSVSWCKRATVEFEQKVLRGDELICQGRTRVACIDNGSQRPRPFPADLASLLRDELANDYQAVKVN